MRGGIRVVAYHGTSRPIARKILRQGFRASENKYDWLGTGMYFFEENLERAWDWARRAHIEPAVVGAVIDLAGVLDLTEHDALASLSRSARMVEAKFRLLREPVPRNRGGRREFDSALIDNHCIWAARKGQDFPVVRGLFEEGERVHRFSSIRFLTHIQLAVRDRRLY